jgi:hypothetical protein
MISRCGAFWASVKWFGRLIWKFVVLGKLEACCMQLLGRRGLQIGRNWCGRRNHRSVGEYWCTLLVVPYPAQPNPSTHMSACPKIFGSTVGPNHVRHISFTILLSISPDVLRTNLGRPSIQSLPVSLVYAETDRCTHFRSAAEPDAPCASVPAVIGACQTYAALLQRVALRLMAPISCPRVSQCV